MSTRACILLLSVLAAASACNVRTEGIPDDEIGLSKADVFEVPEPDAVRDNPADPGDGTPAVRPFEGAPPVISHAVADYLPITRDENLCIDCHHLEEAGEGGPTPIPASHFTDYRNAPGEIGAEVAGARYHCSACHAGITLAEPWDLRPAVSN